MVQIKAVTARYNYKFALDAMRCDISDVRAYLGTLALPSVVSR